MRIEDLAESSTSKMAKTNNRLPRWQDIDPAKNLKDLLNEKEKLIQEQIKIESNKEMHPRCKLRMMKGIRNYS